MRSKNTTTALQATNARLTCGNDACSKAVRAGVTCAQCDKRFHTACANLQGTVTKLTKTADDIWFCATCLDSPLARCVQTVTQKYEALIAQVEKRITARFLTLETRMAELSSSKPATTSPNPRPSKRQRRTPGDETTNTEEAIPVLITEQESPLQQSPSRLFANQDINLACTSNSVSHVPEKTTTVASESGKWLTNQGSKAKKRITEPNGKQPVRVFGAPSISEVPKLKGNKTTANRPLSVICSNVPESTATSLKARETDERNQWSTLCHRLGISATPTNLIRLSRKPNSPNHSNPRLIRVVLSSTQDVETVLLNTHLLRDGENKIRIYPDIPWYERRDRRELINPEARTTRTLSTLYVHGIPEIPNDDKRECQSHDINEWRYVLSLLSLENTVSTSIVRVPSSANYKGAGPKLLRVTLLSEQMAASVLLAWKDGRRMLPPELRVYASKTRTLAEQIGPKETQNAQSSKTITCHATQQEAIASTAGDTGISLLSGNQKVATSPKNS